MSKYQEKYFKYKQKYLKGGGNKDADIAEINKLLFELNDEYVAEILSFSKYCNYKRLVQLKIIQEEQNKQLQIEQKKIIEKIKEIKEENKLILPDDIKEILTISKKRLLSSYESDPIANSKASEEDKSKLIDYLKLFNNKEKKMEVKGLLLSYFSSQFNFNHNERTQMAMKLITPIYPLFFKD